MSKPTKPRWTEEQVSLLRKFYPLGAIGEIVERTGRSRQAVKHMAIALGLSGKYHWRGTPLPVGTEIRRRGVNSYVMVKTLDDSGSIVWVRKSHLIWKETTGAMPPKGMRLVYRDGDRDNCAFDNLELIPDAESANRMTRLRSYPPELQEAVRLLSKVRKALHEREKHSRDPRASVDRSGPLDGRFEGGRPVPRPSNLRSEPSPGCDSEAEARVPEAHAW
ncbi:MAG TPA: HNH endonuclease [Variovorax sp.]|nr:HNH endonuclease [Variovorax sp.]